jgi:MipA family protein
MAVVGRRLVAAVLIALGPGLAAAADLEPPPPVPPPPPGPATYAPAASDWIVTIGGEVRAVPAWPGAPTSLYGLTGFPLLALQKPGDPPFFFGARDSFGVPVLDLGTFQLGPAGSFVWPRYSSQYGQLHGLSDVNWAVQIGGYAVYWPVPWLRLRGEIRQGFNGETGVTGDVYADAVVPLGQFRLSGGPRLTLQSAAAVTPYFSITPAESMASGLTAYSASGGFYSYGAGGQVEYFWSSQWQTHAIVEYERISGSAADSPLVTMRGSPNQLTFGIGATYTFNMHPLWGSLR